MVPARLARVRLGERRESEPASQEPAVVQLLHIVPVYSVTVFHTHHVLASINRHASPNTTPSVSFLAHSFSLLRSAHVPRTLAPTHPSRLLQSLDRYPVKPPEVRFTCEMFHPNVYADGTLFGL